MNLKLDQISKRFDGRLVLDAVSIDLCESCAGSDRAVGGGKIDPAADLLQALKSRRRRD